MSQRKNPPQVDKAGELFILMREVNAPRCSPTAARRIKRACDRLGLSADERLRVFGYLEYCDTDGNPYNNAMPRLW